MMRHLAALGPQAGPPAVISGGIGAAQGPVAAKILVADDDPRNLVAVEELLRTAGVEIVLARSGEDVLRRVLTDDFAVILLDVQMPGLDGYETAAMLRTRPRTSRTPIIFLTAFNKDELHVFRGYSAGAVDYVFKPIEPLILRSKVDVFVDLYRKTEEIRRGAEEERRLLLENLRVRGEKLAAEQALRRREEQQSLVLQSLPIALYTAALEDDRRRLHFTNEAIERISGFSPQAFLQRPDFWEERLHPDDRERVLRGLAGVVEAGSATLEYRWRCPDGAERHILDQAVLMRDEAGRPREIFGLWLDNTERKELESQLLHASKLEAIGRLTGGIAHDFNNMLAVVMGSLELLGKTIDGNEAAKRRARMAMEGARRCADLTNRLLAFSRRQTLQASVTDLGALVPGMLELLQRTLGDPIDIKLAMEDKLWPVVVDRLQFETALVNLAVNARDAMPDGGCLTVAIGNRVLPEDGPRAGEYVEVAVGDTGVGMPADVRERVFEPFFTTKESGKGTGLGLSMIYGFVQQSGGHVALDSVVGEGTTVRLFFPRAEGVADDTDRQEPAESVAADGRGELILVVEDDDDVRQVAVSTLKTLGYGVREAENGQAALSLIDADEEIELVFSDVSMPGKLTGADLARELRRQRPNLPVLLTSGFVSDAEEIEGIELLAKPYRVDDLAQKIRALLD
jgi:PAS domain S-box-containing protein